MLHALLWWSISLILVHSYASARFIQAPFKAETNAVLNGDLSNYVDHLMEIWNVKGISMAVIKPTGDVEYGAWGNRTEDGDPMTPETLFGIASCSKAFLSASMGLLFENYANGRNSTPLPDGLHKINWDTKIKHVLPGEWKLLDEWATEKANFKDILSHSSGLPRHDASYGPDDSPAENVHRLRFLKPAHELREKYSYNNQMFVVGAHIISKYTGSYTNYVTDRIFKPLNMSMTTFSPDKAALTGQLTQTWTAHGQRVPYWIREDDKELMAGPGGVISNVVDLSKWVKMLLRNGSTSSFTKELRAGSGESLPGISDIPILRERLSNAAPSSEPPVTVLPKSVFDAVTTSHVVANGRSDVPEHSITGYGMGWARFSYQGHDMISHSGAIPGLTSHVSFFPADGFGIVALLNSGDKNRVALALHYRVAEDILGLSHKFDAGSPPSPPNPPGQPGTITPLPLSSYSGLYTHPGYGSFILCDPSSTSHYCSSILSSFQSLDAAQSLPLPPPSSVPQLLGTFPRIWSSHIRLVHASNNTNKFHISFTALFPEGYGRSRRPFEVYESDRYDGEVEFVVDEASGEVVGFGYYGVDDMRGDRDSDGEGVGVKDGAIAWFDKL